MARITGTDWPSQMQRGPGRQEDNLVVGHSLMAIESSSSVDFTRTAALANRGVFGRNC